MKIGTLLRIEYIKTVRRRAFWVASAFLALICGIVIIGGFRTGLRGFGPPFVPPFSWAMTVAQIGPVPSVFIALAIAMLVTSEYSWRTARQNVIDGLSKDQFFAAKWLMAMMVTIAFTVLPFAIATGTALYGRVMGATPTTPPAPASTTATQDSTARAAALQLTAAHLAGAAVSFPRRAGRASCGAGRSAASGGISRVFHTEPGSEGGPSRETWGFALRLRLVEVGFPLWPS